MANQAREAIIRMLGQDNQPSEAEKAFAAQVLFDDRNTVDKMPPEQVFLLLYGDKNPPTEGRIK